MTRRKVFLITLAFILALLSSSRAAAQDKAASPIEDRKTFAGNGFDGETLAPPVRELEPEDGWVAVSVESAQETRILVSAYGAESRDNLVPLGALGGGKDGLLVNEHCIQEQRGTAFKVWFCPPAAGRYRLLISGLFDGKAFGPMLVYEVRVKDDPDRAGFYQAVIYEALSSGSADLIRVLHHRFGAWFRLPDRRGRTVLSRAAAEGNTPVIRSILASDPARKEEAWQKDLALVNQVDGEGRTALMLAARKGHREIAELLLARQAAPHLRSDEGRTALDYARGSGDSGLAALLERLPPVSAVYADEDLLGEWEGVITVGNVLHGLGGGADPYSCRLTISRRGSALGARATLLRNLGAEQGRMLFAGTVPQIVPLPRVDQGACVQELDLQVSGKEIFLLGRRQQVLFRSGGSGPAAPLFCLRGTMADPGLIHGYSDVNGENLFYLEKAGPGAARPPVPLERGKTTTVACAYFPQISYSCYVPRSWDPAKPVSALLFSLPEEAKAVPLSPAGAEELGWISVGTQRGSFDTLHVLIDLKRRFRVANGRIHLAGFSYSARVNNSWAGCLAPFLGGVISIGGYYPRERFAPDYGVPVFFITGDRDELFGAAIREDADRLRRTYGDRVEVRFFPGAHAWGAPDLHAEAMRWLSRFQ